MSFDWVISMSFPDKFTNNSAIRFVVAMLFLVGLAFAGSAPASAETKSAEGEDVLKIIVDRAKVVRIARTADTIIVGNPAIVDATIQDARTIVLTGRSFGVTNLIVLDADGNAIVDETIVVQSHEHKTVRIYRRAIRQTLACSPICEPTLTIGDDSVIFNTASEQIENRNKLSEAAAGAN